VLLGVSADNRADVDDLIAKVAAAGGTTGDLVDQGPMYMQPFHDIDGHRWSVTYMDMSAFAE
jgi:predicted lactoylglutathione lyase